MRLKSLGLNRLVLSDISAPILRCWKDEVLILTAECWASSISARPHRPHLGELLQGAQRMSEHRAAGAQRGAF
jgi:hypothetical protein